jgi:hypothetical protein
MDGSRDRDVPALIGRPAGFDQSWLVASAMGSTTTTSS